MATITIPQDILTKRLKESRWADRPFWVALRGGTHDMPMFQHGVIRASRKGLGSTGVKVTFASDDDAVMFKLRWL